LLRTRLLTSPHVRLLWSWLILSISPVQSHPVRSPCPDRPSCASAHACRARNSGDMSTRTWMRATKGMQPDSAGVRVALCLFRHCCKKYGQRCNEERNGNPKQNFGYDLNHRAAAPSVVGAPINAGLHLRSNPNAYTDRKPSRFSGKLDRLPYTAMSGLFHLQSRLSNPPVGALRRRVIGSELSRRMEA
ncbi:hypothetical protein, partial [Methylobacterium brachiatum]